jgi:hypothetical protein
MDPVILFVIEKDPSPSEEALIDRDSDVFDTEITFSPISVSRANLSDHVGIKIPFIEAVQASIVPYNIAQQAFDALKQTLNQTPLLHPPDYN